MRYGSDWEVTCIDYVEDICTRWVEPHGIPITVLEAGADAAKCHVHDYTSGEECAAEVFIAMTKAMEEFNLKAMG